MKTNKPENPFVAPPTDKAFQLNEKGEVVQTMLFQTAPGLTIRDYFAAAGIEEAKDAISKAAFIIADAMLKVREQ